MGINNGLIMLAGVAAGASELLCSTMGPNAARVLEPVFRHFPAWEWRREASAVRGLSPDDAHLALVSRLLLSPSAEIRGEVERVLHALQASSGARRGPASGGAWYTAVHYRSFDGLCTEFTDGDHEFPFNFSGHIYDGRGGDLAAALCDTALNSTMAVLAAPRRDVGHAFAPLFVASDGQAPHRDAALVGHGAVMYDNAAFEPASSGALIVDMLLLAFSDLFICNPVSSVAVTVGRVRAHIGLARCVPGRLPK